MASDTGKLRWKHQLASQPAVSPQPGGPPDPGSDGGMVTSSAWFEPSNGAHPDLVLFGGGYTLYVLDATTGNLFWRHDYTGRPDLPADPVHDDARIFSSPVVVDGKVVVGVSVDGLRGRRGYVVAADAANRRSGVERARPTSTRRAPCSTTAAATCGRRERCSRHSASWSST